MAEGWLWVSTLKQTASSSSKAMTPALSLKTDRQKSSLPLADQVLGALEDRVLDQVLVVARAELLAGLIADFDLDRALERLVDAVLAPGLGEHLQLDVGRLAVRLRGSSPGSPSSPPATGTGAPRG